ncbi:hypothetical protein GEMRC1_011605 [Eukaryota sp. GEM-RC1]
MFPPSTYSSQTKGYSCYRLPADQRQSLLSMAPPKYPDVVAEHITYEFNVPESIPPAVTNAYIVGYAAANGVEAVVVEINGSIVRPDGMWFHITYSLDKSQGRTAIQSNNLLMDGWMDLRQKVPLELEPCFVPFG